MRTCSRCGECKPIEQFPERKVGSGRRYGHCRDCKALYQREWYEKNKERHKANVAEIRRERIRRNREIIEAAKSVPCMDCGGRFPPYVMDFDHVRGVKRGTIAFLVREHLRGGPDRGDRKVRRGVCELPSCPHLRQEADSPPPQGGSNGG
jgi:hypothetical protein